MSKNNLIITIVIVVLVGTLGFFGGVQYQKSQRVSFARGNMPQRGTPIRPGNGFGRPINGEITAIDANTITVKTIDGDSKIVVYSLSTQINKTTSGAVSDLKIGEQVMVVGSEGANGTLTAQTISVGGNMLKFK
jgi:hypothetical protein